MSPLKIETTRDWAFNTHVITGFTEDELTRLREKKNQKDEIVRILDERNGGIGTCWACGYGIYGVSVGESGACVRTGNSCD